MNPKNKGEASSETVVSRGAAFRIPKGMFEAEDLQLIQKRYGNLRDGKDYYIFTKKQFEGLLTLINENKYLNMSEATDRGFSIRVAAKILALSGTAHYTSDKAALLSCIIGIFPIDPDLAIRLLPSIK
jgi:hypothetical protein